MFRLTHSLTGRGKAHTIENIQIELEGKNFDLIPMFLEKYLQKHYPNSSLKEVEKVFFFPHFLHHLRKNFQFSHFNRFTFIPLCGFMRKTRKEFQLMKAFMDQKDLIGSRFVGNQELEKGRERKFGLLGLLHFFHSNFEKKHLKWPWFNGQKIQTLSTR